MSAVVTKFPLSEPELTDVQIGLRDELRTRAQALEEAIHSVADGRYRAMAMTSLEASVLWAEKGLVP